MSAYIRVTYVLSLLLYVELDVHRGGFCVQGPIIAAKIPLFVTSGDQINGILESRTILSCIILSNYLRDILNLSGAKRRSLRVTGGQVMFLYDVWSLVH